MFFIYVCIPLFLFLMIRNYDKKKDNIMSNLKRMEFLAKLKAKEEGKAKKEDIYEDNPWRRFEKEVANLFAENWWEVKLWPGSNDGWKDIVIKKENEIYLVQCKHYRWNKFVSPKHIRDFQGAIDLYEKQNNIEVKWIFITSWKTTYQARETANTLWIELWDGWNRMDKITCF